MNVQDAIRQSYISEGFTPAELELVYSIAELRTFADGEAILRQFDENKDLYVLASGKASILTVIGEPIGVVKPGMPMGEISFLDGKPRSVSVVSIGESTAVVLPAEPLRAILGQNKEMAVKALTNISRVLCARLRNANNNIAALMALDESDTSLTR